MFFESTRVYVVQSDLVADLSFAFAKVIPWTWGHYTTVANTVDMYAEKTDHVVDYVVHR